MKSTIRNFIVVTFTLAIFGILAPYALAQCVQCKPSGSCFVCGPGSAGGCECVTAGCNDCILSFPCAGGKCGVGLQNGAKIKVDENTIMAIAEAHPRFAVALALANRGGGIPGWAKFSSFPTYLRAPEVANWLNWSLPEVPEETKAFFREYKKRPARVKQLTIEFTANKLDDTRTVIRGVITNPFPDDPVATQLELEAIGDKVSSWRVY